MSWRGLQEKPVDMPIWKEEWNAVVQALNDLKKWIDEKVNYTPVRYIIQRQQVPLDATELKKVLALDGPGLIFVQNDGSGDALYTIQVCIDSIKRLDLRPDERALYVVAFSSGMEVYVYNPWAEPKSAYIPNIVVIGLAKTVSYIDSSIVSEHTGELKVV